jgi:hypothetical protein
MNKTNKSKSNHTKKYNGPIHARHTKAHGDKRTRNSCSCKAQFSIAATIGELLISASALRMSSSPTLLPCFCASSAARRHRSRARRASPDTAATLRAHNSTASAVKTSKPSRRVLTISVSCSRVYLVMPDGWFEVCVHGQQW